MMPRTCSLPHHQLVARAWSSMTLAGGSNQPRLPNRKEVCWELDRRRVRYSTSHQTLCRIVYLQSTLHDPLTSIKMPAARRLPSAKHCFQTWRTKRKRARLLQQVLPVEDVSQEPQDDMSSRYANRPGFSLPLMTNNFRRFNSRYVCLAAWLILISP